MDALLSITGVSVRFGGGGALAGVGFQVPRIVLPVGQRTQRAFDIAGAAGDVVFGRAVWSGSGETAREDLALVNSYLGLAG